VDQLGQKQSLQCSLTSTLELSTDGPQTAGLVIQPFQTVAEDVFIWSVGPKISVNPPFNCTLEKSAKQFAATNNACSHLRLRAALPHHHHRSRHESQVDDWTSKRTTNYTV